MLFLNLLKLAEMFARQPEKLALYMKQSLLEAPSHGEEEEEEGAVRAVRAAVQAAAAGDEVFGNELIHSHMPRRRPIRVRTASGRQGKCGGGRYIFCGGKEEFSVMSQGIC